MLPIARRDIERLQQLLAIQPRLLDTNAPVRAQRALLHRAVLEDALTWLEVHGDQPDVVAHWRALQAQTTQPESAGETYQHAADGPYRRHRRRRRRRRRAPFIAPQE